MKKLIIVLISVILLLALTSCDFNSVFDEHFILLFAIEWKIIHFLFYFVLYIAKD